MDEYLRDRLAEALPCSADDVGSGVKTIRLVPDGEVQSSKGTFLVDAESGARVASAFEAHGNELVIDFEHQSMGGDYAAPDGLSPAAGWATKIFYKRGRGIMALVRWNDRARGLIRSGEYRYLSPTVVLCKADRKVIAVVSAGLTNTPAIAGMDALAASDRERRANAEAEFPTLMADLASALGFEEGTPDTDVLRAAIDRLRGGGDAGKSDDEAIANHVREAFKLGSETGAEVVVKVLDARIAERDEAAALSAELAQQKADLLFDTLAVKTNKVNPHSPAARHFRDLARMDPETFKKVIACAHAFAPPGRLQPPTPEQMTRVELIRDAVRDFRITPQLGRQTTVDAYVNLSLRDAGMPKLSEDEVRGFL